MQGLFSFAPTGECVTGRKKSLWLIGERFSQSLITFGSEPEIYRHPQLEYSLPEAALVVAFVIGIAIENLDYSE